MLDHETAALLRGGCALIVGAGDPGGMPHALRGWGIDVLEDDPLRVRVLLDPPEHDAIGHARCSTHQGPLVAIAIAACAEH